MARALKRRSGNRKYQYFLYQVSFHFVTQLLEIMESEDIGRAELAKKLGVSKGRVSQFLNHPGNVSLDNIVRYSRKLDRKVSVVVYDDGDRTNQRGPILPQIFLESWKRAGSPHDFFELNNRNVVSGWAPTYSDFKHGQGLPSGFFWPHRITAGTDPGYFPYEMEPVSTATTSAQPN